MTQFLYLHGLASGPNSKKAASFKKVFERQYLPFLVPDLEGGDFENLTISKQLKMIEAILKRNSGERFGLIGSSLGAYLAAIAAEANPSIAAVYLMAPAFRFLNRWKNKLEHNYGTKRIPDFIQIYHYRYNEEKKLNTRIFEDAEEWEKICFLRKIPTRLVHGIYDDSVNIQVSRDFASTRPWCEFLELDSDHSLLSHLNWLIDDCLQFFKKYRLI